VNTTGDGALATITGPAGDVSATPVMNAASSE
jgi:hypothetical protein